MADGGEVALVLSIFQLDLFLRQPVSIDRANQLLVFLQQPLAEFLSFLLVHYRCPLCPRKTLIALITGNRSICFAIPLSTHLCLHRNNPQHDTRQRKIVPKRSQSTGHPKQPRCQSHQDSLALFLRRTSNGYVSMRGARTALKLTRTHVTFASGKNFRGYVNSFGIFSRPFSGRA